ncbi:MAG: outer membrane protein [Gammaproteobacteria bacterium]
MIKYLKLCVYCLYGFLSILEVQALSSNEDWTGFYIGTKMGAALEQFDMTSVVQPSAFLNPAQTDVINNAGNQSTNPVGFLTGIETGYNWKFQHILIGLETDIQALSISGKSNSNALPYPDGSDSQFVVSSYANNNWLMTARPRLGIITPYGLVYTTGGLGLTWLQSDFLLSSDEDGFESQRVNTVRAGYVVGGGIETSISPNLSLKAEYLFENYPLTHAQLMNQLIPLGQSMSNSVSLKGSLITVGLNYHFNQHLPLWFQASEFWDASQWQTNLGARVFISSGTVGAPQPLLNSSNIGDLLASRLIFSDLIGISEEVYGRVEHASGFFAKGFLGAGSLTDGQLNDEDFPAKNAYSNTLSNAEGNLSYGVIDLGYSFLQSSTGKTGVFIGYNYNAQNIKIYNCQQLAGDVVCSNPNAFSNFLALSETDSFNSLRIGLTSQYQITDQLTLTPEVAYIPLVSFNGLDMHNARQLIGPENSNRGDGTMLEASLDYQVNETWAVGLGGRYWAWNMRTGTVTFDFIGNPEELIEPARFNTTRYGGFLQVSYRHGDLHSPDLDHSMRNWEGVFVGGNIGGAWGSSTWSDPFGSTEGAPGFVNVAGFGDNISSSGPLGGGNLNINWQNEQWVYGIAGSINASDIRGENTLFSGIGGINGQSKTNYFGTIVGRLGRTLNDSLIYINSGTAVLNTQYTLNGNTGALALGINQETVSTWGWTIGTGLEFTFNDNWSSSIEYEYLGIPNVINEDNANVNQSLNLVKVGVNYRLI